VAEAHPCRVRLRAAAHPPYGKHDALYVLESVVQILQRQRGGPRRVGPRLCGRTDGELRSVQL
jgi:hypothetical protein